MKLSVTILCDTEKSVATTVPILGFRAACYAELCGCGPALCAHRDLGAVHSLFSLLRRSQRWFTTGVSHTW